MHIVVLDGYTLNPGDLSWDRWQSLGECVVHDRTAAEETAARAAAADIVLTNKTVLSREVIEQLPNLKYIGVLATGYNVVDLSAAAEREIPVTNVPEYATSSVVQMVFAHLLNLCHHVAEHSARVHDGAWAASRDFCFWEYPLIELADRTLGIVGLGRIGRAVAATATAFGMKVLAYDPIVDSDIPPGVVMTELDNLFAASDAVSLHCPLTDETRGLVNKERLERMKSTAFLINTGRGPLIDEDALADALNGDRIGGAGLDVLAAEPPPADAPLLAARNCYVTPHIAWATQAARRRLMGTAFENVQAFLEGTPVNVVNGV
jgi:glycerate dehydrogenase